jgi:hypothetical protein
MMSYGTSGYTVDSLPDGSRAYFEEIALSFARLMHSMLLRRDAAVEKIRSDRFETATKAVAELVTQVAELRERINVLEYNTKGITHVDGGQEEDTANELP